MIRVYHGRGEISRPSSDAFLRRGLADFLKVLPQDLSLGRHSSGQPFVEWKQPVSFSLSHSGGCLALAVSLEYDVGLDIQEARDFNPKIFERICTPQELSTGPESSDDFYRLWTQKEGALKCLGMGLAYPMNQLDTDQGQKQIRVLKPSEDFSMLFAGRQDVLAFESLGLFGDMTDHLVWSPTDKVPLIECSPN